MVRSEPFRWDGRYFRQLILAVGMLESLSEATTLRRTQNEKSIEFGSKAFTWSSPEEMTTYMRRCIVLAKNAVAAGGAPFGALIVDPSRHTIIVEGANHAGINPIWHGEMDAITKLAESFGNKPVNGNVHGYELYTSAEPCSMCASAIVWGGFGRIVWGSNISFVAAHGTDQINITSQQIVQSESFAHILIASNYLSNETDPLYVT